MPTSRKGTQLPLSPARRVIVEGLRHGKMVPSLPVSRPIRIPAVVAARVEANPAPSWTAVFMRAFGLLSQRRPELRRAYIPFPWPHLYQHPESGCAVMVEREWQGELVVMGAKVRSPEKQTLQTIHAQLRHFKEAPVLKINYFRKWLRVGALPGFLRRFTLWHSFYLSGYLRAKRLGTFMMSTVGDLGADQGHPLTVLTTYFTFGPVLANGETTARIIYDHRVTDERCIARCLGDLEQILNTEILAELRGLRRLAA
jgi:hypothetical protein